MSEQPNNMSLNSALELMQTHKTGHPELNIPGKPLTQEEKEYFKHRDYQLCSNESKELLQCVMNHPGHVDECDNVYKSLRNCQQGLKH